MSRATSEPVAEPKRTRKTTSKRAASAGPAAASSPAVATVSAETPTSCCQRPSHAAISQRAYEIWVAKGRPMGQDHENWAQAERELLEKSR